MSFDEASIVPLRAVVSEVIDNRGKTPPTQNRGNALIEINAINAERKYPNYEMVKKYVSDEIYQTWFRKGHPQKNDVLIPTVGTIGSVAFVNESHGCIAQNIIALRINESKCLGEFLYYYLKLNSSRMAMLGLDIGSVQPSIKVPHLMNMAIRIPSIKKQRTISATLSALDDKIELNNRINKTLEEMAQALFKQWFVDFEFPDENGLPYKSSGGEMEESEVGMIPKGWRCGEVVDLCSEIFSGGTPLTTNENLWNGRFPWLSSGETRNAIIVETSKSITEEGVRNSSTRLAEGLSIILCKHSYSRTLAIEYIQPNDLQNKSKTGLISAPSFESGQSTFS